MTTMIVRTETRDHPHPPKNRLGRSQKHFYHHWANGCLAASLTCSSVVVSLFRLSYKSTTIKSTISFGMLPVKKYTAYLTRTYREKGVGSTSDPGPSFSYDGNKTEVLRLILVLLSRQIYVPPSSLFTKPSLYTLHLVQQTPRRDVLTILCSLLNTTMSASSYGSSTISSVAGKLPYNHLMFKGEDPRTSLISMCFQVLCVLLDFQSDSARDKPSKTDETHPPTPTPRTNAFRYFLMKLVRLGRFYDRHYGRA